MSTPLEHTPYFELSDRFCFIAEEVDTTVELDETDNEREDDSPSVV